MVKKQVFDALPPYVFFHLKRFDYDPYNETRFKLDTPLSFSTTLSFLASSYELQGVITHEGTATSGHYRCFLFNHGQWTETSDLKVAHHAFNDPSVDWVRRDGGEGVERLVSGREVIHRSMSGQEVIHRSMSSQEVIHRSMSGREVIHRSMSGQEVIHRSMSSHHLIHRSMSSQEVIHRSMSGREVIHRSMSGQEVIHRSMSSHHLIHRSMSGQEVIHRSMSSHHLIHRSTNPQESRPMTRQSSNDRSTITSNDRSTTSNRSTSTTSNPLKPTPYILLYRRRRSDNAPSSLRILTSEAFWVLLETLLDRPDDPIMPLLGRIRTYGPLSPP